MSSMTELTKERLFPFDFETRHASAPVVFRLWVWGTVLGYDDTRLRACLIAKGCKCLTK